MSSIDTTNTSSASSNSISITEEQNSRSSSTTLPPELAQIDKDMNKLIFPGIERTYEYDSKDFVYTNIIEAGRHMVKEYTYVPLNICMAVKTIRIPYQKYQNTEKDEKLTSLKKEIDNFRLLSNHPNIVNFYGLCSNDGEAMICMELMDMSLYDLYLVVHGQNETFPEKILGYIAVQILEALKFCKSKSFIHRDIKPKNILLNQEGEVKLCDFGESRILKDSLASTFVGTIAYWPPERFDSKVIEGEYRYDVRSDIWSLGVTLTEIAYGKLPFLDEHGQPLCHENSSQSNIVTVQKWILNLDINELINRCLGQFYSNECVEFIRWCLEKLPNRPKYDALMETPFYQKFKNSVSRKDMSHFIQKFEYI